MCMQGTDRPSGGHARRGGDCGRRVARRRRRAQRSARRQPVLPDVAQRLDERRRASPSSVATRKTTLVRHGDLWTVEEKGNYPADAAKVHQASSASPICASSSPRPRRPISIPASRSRTPARRTRNRRSSRRATRRAAARRDHRGQARSTSSAAAMTASMCASPATRNPGSRAARSTWPAIRRSGSTRS